MPMSDAIENLAQDLSQANPSENQGKMYLVGDQYLPFGALVPNMAGVRVGDKYVNDIGDSWNWDANDYDYAPSTLGTGEGIDFNVRDKPVERINIKSGDEQDAFVRTGIGTTLDPKTEDRYGFTGLIPPDKTGTFIGVQYLTKDETEKLIDGQTPTVPQGVVTRGETVSIPGKGLPDYVPIGQMENGDVLYADRNNLRDTIIRPSAYSISQENLDKGIVPQKFNFGTTTELAPSQKTPTSVGAAQPTTASEGGFDNTGGNVTVGPGNVTAGPGGTTNVTPDYKPKPEVKPGDEFKDSPWTIASGNPPRKPIVTPEGVTEGTVVPGTGGIKVGDYYPDDQGNKWNWEKGVWEKDPAQGGTKTPPVTTPPVTTPPVTKPPVITPPGGGTPSGGGQPGGGPTIIPPREPVTPLVRREVVIPTKGTKEVPLPDRQADPFAKLYADLLANAQQQKDQYRYINYDPDQIMNAAMSGFRRRGAMRSLQGY